MRVLGRADSLFLSTVDGECAAIHDVFGVALGIVTIAIFVLHVFAEVIFAVFDFVFARVVRGVGGFFYRPVEV